MLKDWYPDFETVSHPRHSRVDDKLLTNDDKARLAWLRQYPTLTARARNSLFYYGPDPLELVRTIPDRELLCIPQFGKHSLASLRDALKSTGGEYEQHPKSAEQKGVA